MVEKITIDGQFITLGQFLKFTDIISSGGMIKDYLNDHDIYVNGMIERRRGRKLYPDDLIRIADDQYQITK